MWRETERIYCVDLTSWQAQEFFNALLAGVLSTPAERKGRKEKILPCYLLDIVGVLIQEDPSQQHRHVHNRTEVVWRTGKI